MRHLLAIVGVLIFALPMAAADDPPPAGAVQQFDALWGEAVRRAAASADRRDDAKLAAEILETAKGFPHESRDDRRTKIYVLRRAQALAIKDPSGFATAEAILRLLPDVDVELTDAAAAELLDLREARFRATPPGPDRDARGRRVADDLMRAGLSHLADRKLAAAKRLFDRAERVAVMSKSPRDALAIILLRLVDARAVVARTVDDLRKAYARQRRQETARKLVELNLFELDDPAEAAKYLTDAGDAELTTMVGLAQKKVADLSPAECLLLANWCFERRAGLSVSGQSVAVSRARELYGRYVMSNPPKTLELMRVGKRLDEIAGLVEERAVVLLPGGKGQLPGRPVPVDLDDRAPEASDVVLALSHGYPDALNGVKRLTLARVHDATALRCNGGGAKQVPGSYARQAVEGGAGQIWLWGIYEHLDPGRYVVVYRMRRVSPIAGGNVCFLDVCVNGNTIAENRPPADALPPDEWRPLPVMLNLGGPTTVEYRLWSHNNTFAVDRIYVLKVVQ